MKIHSVCWVGVSSCNSQFIKHKPRKYNPLKVHSTLRSVAGGQMKCLTFQFQILNIYEQLGEVLKVYPGTQLYDNLYRTCHFAQNNNYKYHQLQLQTSLGFGCYFHIILYSLTRSRKPQRYFLNSIKSSSTLSNLIFRN